MEWTKNRVYEDNPKTICKSIQWKIRLFSVKNCFQLSFSRGYDENTLYIALQLPWTSLQLLLLLALKSLAFYPSNQIAGFS